MKDLGLLRIFEVFGDFLRSTNDCLSEHISETSQEQPNNNIAMRLSLSSVLLVLPLRASLSAFNRS